jgi:hypothetical protein
MRNIELILLILIPLFGSGCGNRTGKQSGAMLQSKDTGTAEIAFKVYEHNFGKVLEGEKVGYIFTFENKGTGSLVIASATTSCGCTVPEYDTKPIPPGGTGNMEVVFDTSGKNGIQTKTITVRSNAATPVVLLKINAEVLTINN